MNLNTLRKEAEAREKAGTYFDGFPPRTVLGLIEMACDRTPSELGHLMDGVGEVVSFNDADGRIWFRRERG